MKEDIQRFEEDDVMDAKKFLENNVKAGDTVYAIIFYPLPNSNTSRIKFAIHERSTGMTVGATHEIAAFLNLPVTNPGMPGDEAIICNGSMGASDIIADLTMKLGIPYFKRLKVMCI